MTLPILYIIGMAVIPAFAWVFLESIKDGGINEWYDRMVLFPLRKRNSKLAMPLGECEMCFTIWLGTMYGTAITAYWLYDTGSWWVWVVPTYLFLNMGVASMIYKIFKQLK